MWHLEFLSVAHQIVAHQIKGSACKVSEQLGDAPRPSAILSGTGSRQDSDLVKALFAGAGDVAPHSECDQSNV